MFFVAFWWICSYFLILVLLNLDANHHFLFKKNPPQRYTPPHLRSNNRPSMAASHKASGCHFSGRLPCRLGFTKTSPSRASKIQPSSFFLPNGHSQQKLGNGKWWRFPTGFFLKKWKGEAQFCTGKIAIWKFHLTPNQKKTWLWVPAVNFPGCELLWLENLTEESLKSNKHILTTQKLFPKALKTKSLTQNETPRVLPPTSQQKRNGIFQLHTRNPLMTLVLVGVRPYFEEVDL